MEDYYSKMNSLDQILSDIMIHLHPDFLKWNYQNKIDTKNLDKKKLSQYYQLLTSANFVFKKIIKYELYFSEFYPMTDKIRKTEALEHHIHAYLEDLDILKNKVCHFLGVLKNDLKKIASNKNEIDDALKQFIEKVLGVFNNVSKNRNPHHHKGMKFLDGDLVDSDLAHTMLQDNNPLRNQFKPEFLEELKKRETGSFGKAKSNWIALAQKNNEQISGFVDETFKRNKGLIYQFLGIKPIKELMG